MQCKDVMLTLVYRCREQDTISHCAKLMRDQRIGFVPVVNDRGGVIGVVTDRDIVVRAIAADKASSTLVHEIMTPGPLLTCRADEDLRRLEKRMAEQKKSRAMVFDATDQLVGVISLSDIAEAERSPFRTGRLLKEVARRESVAITRP